VYASPADDLPRLAYADFLEAQGKPLEAEIIRLECATDRLYAGHVDDDPLLNRLYELREANFAIEHPNYDPDEPYAPPDTRGLPEFRSIRGFPGHADIRDPAEFIAADEQAAWPPTFESLDIFAGFSVNTWTAAESRRVLTSSVMARLRSLTIGDGCIDPSLAGEFFASSAPLRLETLSLNEVPWALVHALGRLPALRRLRLSSIGDMESWHIPREEFTPLGISSSLNQLIADFASRLASARTRERPPSEP